MFKTQVYSLTSRKMKKLRSRTPLMCERKIFTLELKSSAEAFGARCPKKDHPPECKHYPSGRSIQFFSKNIYNYFGKLYKSCIFAQKSIAPITRAIEFHSVEPCI